jgi:hypothetical protein
MWIRKIICYLIGHSYIEVNYLEQWDDMRRGGMDKWWQCQRCKKEHHTSHWA